MCQCAIINNQTKRKVGTIFMVTLWPTTSLGTQWGVFCKAQAVTNICNERANSSSFKLVSSQDRLTEIHIVSNCTEHLPPTKIYNQALFISFSEEYVITERGSLQKLFSLCFSFSLNIFSNDCWVNYNERKRRKRKIEEEKQPQLDRISMTCPIQVAWPGGERVGSANPEIARSGSGCPG